MLTSEQHRYSNEKNKLSAQLVVDQNHTVSVAAKAMECWANWSGSDFSSPAPECSYRKIMTSII